jgi:hypothetical protein
MQMRISIGLGCLLVGFALTGCSKEQSARSGANRLPTNATVTTVATADPAVDINLRWQVGRRYHLRMETIMSSEADAGAGAARPPAKITLSMAHEYAVSARKELPGDGRKLELEFLAQKFQYQVGAATLASFDSAQDPKLDGRNPAAPVLRKLIGARIQCETDGSGRAVKVDGFKELTSRMADGEPMVQAFLESVFSEVNLKQLLDFAQTLQSDRAVKPGDDWPLHLELADPVGTLVVKGQCDIMDWETRSDRRCARIKFSGDITSQSDPQATSSASVEAGTISGRVWFDPALGMPVDSSCDQHMTLKTVAQGKITISKVNQTTNVRLVGVDDAGR